jgi:tRNA (guanine-N7-)-methyltransferase
MNDETEGTRRPVRSYVLREGRMTDAQRRAFGRLWNLYGIDFDPGAGLDPADVFARAQPVWLEIGFGNGDALADMAEAHPERNFIGVEVHRPGVGRLLLTLEARGIGNVRVIRADAVEVLRALPAASLTGVLLFFPDPWPKKKHHKRRILQPAFAALVARALAPGGLFHMATDWADYAAQMLEVMEAAADFENTTGPGRFAARPAWRPLTRFERRGERLGHPVHDLIYRRR